ncbi:ABC-F family ATP-binding cassette domain-containing protein [Glacieibacterium frigidum]|uniref:ABC-F family ATP-binding cassette domain-containing protein n=1 Tax=Glacieibacterium frigidum TaxID=2593303 RepID=A0A552U952_9SPHN|nr:ABC-F family ATP-binding cassette domain-containing protein [Glacieibacterium frigidum]TRW14740.1 ABC-F family ATP-binding cassette domain-containing protein [Glacieibacterium frigidum]
MLTIDAVTVRLGGRVILDRATAALPVRARVGLIGRNGAGKSTLMKVVAGMLDPDEGNVSMPKASRLGYVAQEAPAGTGTPFETVLAADTERAALLAEEEAMHATGHDSNDDDQFHIAEIHERLNAIDAHTAPARASRILVGLGFDEAAQHRPLDSFSGGWKMRVALASLLFSGPDMLLLDEPSNHLDLEATLWLEDFLKSYRGTILVISHERDLLNNVVDYILHLEGGKTTLYAGGYDAFERQRAERLAQLASAREAQAAQRAKLQDYVARNSARASTAKQAQSRQKALAKMQPIAEAASDPTLVFDFPSPQVLRPPLIQLEGAAVGYDGKPILQGLDLRLDPDDRLALLGRNGNGKTTLARLLSGQLAAMAGSVAAPGKLKVGYFTQYQVEELDTDATPLQHMSRLMKGGTPTQVRSQLGRFGFSGVMAEQKIGKMSGGEKARLALALITRDAPHLLILDEPTNHLDVDAREALVQALNEYGGAVVVVSHDRHMLEASADRLVLVDNGRAAEFDGSLDDYTAQVLGKSDAPRAGGPASKRDKKDERRAAAAAREATASLRKAVQAAEAETAKWMQRRQAIDRALFDPSTALPGDAKRTSAELMRERGDVERRLAASEAAWLAASEALDSGMAAAA